MRKKQALIKNCMIKKVMLKQVTLKINNMYAYIYNLSRCAHTFFVPAFFTSFIAFLHFLINPSV